MNDDVFMARPLQPSAFFSGGGVAKVFLSDKHVGGIEALPADLPVVAAAKRNREILARHFGVWTSLRYRHTPHAQIKAVLEEIDQAIPEEVRSVSHSRFRHPRDISVASSLHHGWALATGRAVVSDISYMYIDLGGEDRRAKLERLAMRSDLDVFCLNQVKSVDLRGVRADVREVLELKFPQPSSFEREDQ